MLPSLTADEKLHSEAVAALIRSRIEAAGGWISFADFMEMALYAPGLGYYSAGPWRVSAAGGTRTRITRNLDPWPLPKLGYCSEVVG